MALKLQLNLLPSPVASLHLPCPFLRWPQALVDVAAQGGCLASALAVMELVQALTQVGVTG